MQTQITTITEEKNQTQNQLQKQLEEICAKALNEVENAVTSANIEEIKLEYLSRKSVLNNIKKGLKDLSPEQRPIVGAFANEVAQKIEQAVELKEKAIYEKELKGEKGNA